MDILGHIKWDDVYAQIIAGLLVLLIAWISGLFRWLARLLSRAIKGTLTINRDPNFAGWYSNFPQEEIQDAVGRPHYRLSLFVRSRWWLTNYASHPVAIAHAYFISNKPDMHGNNKHICQGVAQISDTGERSLAAQFEKIQHVELDAMLGTDLLDGDYSLTGYFVLVDQTGKEYRTETLKHYRDRAVRV
jgi:hypothetical protein